ncbi:MAG: hypothetical protein ACLFTW_10195 [Chitinispirillaceae bacterium]
MDETVVFGGWGVEPELLMPLFGKEVRYVDINILMPSLIEREQLRNDWVDIVLDKTGLIYGAPTCIAGWSTGAMIAYEVAKKKNPQNTFLLSATPCFCRKPAFKYGTRKSVLNQMIQTLCENKTEVLSSFFERCGIPFEKENAEKYDTLQLKSGLVFLREADLHPLTPLANKPIFLNGRDDEIVPWTASVHFSEKAGGVYLDFPGPHAFFLDNSAEIVRSMIETVEFMDNLA